MLSNGVKNISPYYKHIPPACEPAKDSASWGVSNTMTKTQAQVVYKLKFNGGIIRHNESNGQIMLEYWECMIGSNGWTKSLVTWDILKQKSFDALLSLGLIKFSRKDWFVNEYVLNA